MLTLKWIFAYILLSALIIIASDLTRRYYNYRWQLNQDCVILELTPPSISHKSALATEQLFSVLYHLGINASFKDKLLGRSHVFSFEVVSTRHEGIRYLVRLAKYNQAVFEQQVAAYLPGVKYKAVKDYLKDAYSDGYPRIAEFTHGRHFAYPLANHETLSQHDPIAYITGSMTKLQPDELVAFQLVLSPVALREISRIKNKLVMGNLISL